MKKITITIYVFAQLLYCTTCSAQPLAITDYVTTPDGIRIYYEIKGEGKPVVLIHGFMNNQENWKKTVLYTNLIVTGYTVITIDLRGNGKSDKPHNTEAYANDAEAKDVMQLITLLKLDTYFVVGYSRGAIIASRLLILDRRVTKTVMGGMGSDFTNPEWPRRIMFYQALNNEDVPELKDMIQYVQNSGLDQQALACQQKEQPATSREEFAKVNVPVLIICGDEDSANGSAEALANIIPTAVLKKVPGDHNNTAQTEKFSDAVISFLEKM